MSTTYGTFAAQIAAACLLFANPVHTAANSTEENGSPKLPVARTIELTHVKPAHYAVALDKDPERIFRFVRDRVRFESYRGALRGDEGTLLASAGNSVDQSILLASMLKQAGYLVRFVQGKLPDDDARRLVESMWAKRPQSKSGEKPASPKFQKTVSRLKRYVQRDYRLIREKLKNSKVQPPGTAVRFDVDALVKESRDHVWVQVEREGKWVDLDPAFPKATPGRVFAKNPTPLDRLPKKMFHRMQIRIRVEEYTGSKRSERTLLEVNAPATDFSGRDVVLTHQPENWKGPVSNLQSALNAAITDTGRIKPVLVLGGKEWKAGQPFREKPPTQRGIGGVFNRLKGIGTRKAVPVATALWIEFIFTAPDGTATTARRDIFDRIGPARRNAGKPLTATAVRSLTKSAGGTTLTESVFSLFLTTGPVDASHFPRSRPEDVEKKDNQNHFRIDRTFRRVHLAYAALADTLSRQMPINRTSSLRFYPDSPRVYIAELSKRGESLKFTYDLRIDAARGIGNDAQPEDLFHGRILRGVIAGTMERIVTELLISRSDRSVDKGPEPVTTTSRVFDAAGEINTLLLSSPAERLPRTINAGVRSRIRASLRKNRLVLVPEKPVQLGSRQRTGWWQVDPKTGETIAVTDDGLHGSTSFEYKAYVKQRTRDTYSVRVYCGPAGPGGFNLIHSYSAGVHNLGRLVAQLQAQGIRVIYPGLYAL